jgi:hypothetical protein
MGMFRANGTCLDLLSSSNSVPQLLISVPGGAVEQRRYGPVRHPLGAVDEHLAQEGTRSRHNASMHGDPGREGLSPSGLDLPCAIVCDEKAVTEESFATQRVHRETVS